MNLEARKLEFIQEFLKIQSEEILLKLEKILQKENSDQRIIKPMSAEELNIRIDKSMEDSKNGRLTEVNELLTEIEKWT